MRYNALLNECSDWHTMCERTIRRMRGVNKMESFDIFVRRRDGKLTWIECVDDLVIAEQQAIRFSGRFTEQA
jgi:hypothetical protein